MQTVRITLAVLAICICALGTPELVVAQGDITVDPTSHRYGNVAIGASASQTFIVTNAGRRELRGRIPILEGPNADHFSIDSGETSFKLRAGKTHPVAVSFNPTSEGLKQATLKFRTTDEDENPFEVALAGTGVRQPDISVRPSRHDYGAVDVGASASKTFVVKNEGSADLMARMPVLVGLNTDQFQIDAGATPFALAPSPLDSHLVVVSFNPASISVKVANLRFASTDPDENPLDVPLTGKGVLCDLSVDPTSHDFGEVSKLSFVDKVFVLSNADTATTNCVGTISIAGDPEFSIVCVRDDDKDDDDNGDDDRDKDHSQIFNHKDDKGDRGDDDKSCSEFKIKPGRKHKFVVRFDCRKSTPSAKSATLTISSNDPGGDILVPITGICLAAPDIAAQPSEVRFGRVKLGQHRDKTFRLQNVGSADLNVTSFKLAGSHGNDFVLLNITSPLTLKPGESILTTVRFSPSAVDNRTGRAKFFSNDPDEPEFIVKFRGEGRAVHGITVTPTSELTTTEGGGTATFEISANSAPSSDVTVPLTTSDTTEGTVHPSVILPAGSVDPVTVTVTGVDDSDIDGDARYTIITGDPTSTDALYDALTADDVADVTLTNQDDEAAPPSDTAQQEFVFTEAFDTYIDGRRTDYNNGANELLRLGNKGSGHRRPHRILLRFDFLAALQAAGVTSSGQVKSATLEMHVFGAFGQDKGGLPIDAIRINRDWAEGTSDYVPATPGEATYHAAKHGVETWAAAGVSAVPADRESTPDDTHLIDSVGQVDWDVSASVQNAIATEQSFGWLLRSQDESKDEYYRLYSSEHATEELRPKLVIVVEVPPAAATMLAKGQAGASELHLEAEAIVPENFSLAQNFPNPFNPETQIRYEIASSATVTLTVFDVTGAVVRRLLDRETKSAGTFSVVWDGRDGSGGLSASGLYFYRILIQPQAGAETPFAQTRRMILLK